MQQREAPSADTMADNTMRTLYGNVNTEAFLLTVNVSPKKYISNKLWGKYTTIEQEILLLKTLNDCIEEYPMLDLKYNFELTKQGMKHLHASLYTSRECIDAIQFKFHKKFGMPNLDPNICANVVKTNVHKSHTDAYVLKEVSDNNEVPNYNMFLRHKEARQNL